MQFVSLRGNFGKLLQVHPFLTLPQHNVETSLMEVLRYLKKCLASLLWDSVST